jgi:hypothetical protein
LLRSLSLSSLALGGVNAAQEVNPEPGMVSEVKLFGALRTPWETGWARWLTLTDDQGQVLVPVVP